MDDQRYKMVDYIFSPLQALSKEVDILGYLSKAGLITLIHVFKRETFTAIVDAMVADAFDNES